MQIEYICNLSLPFRILKNKFYGIICIIVTGERGNLFPRILHDLDFNTRIKCNGGRLRDRAAQSWRLMSLKLTRCED